MFQSDPPSVISTPSGRIEIALGTVFEIVCEARGIPHPVISWSFNGQTNANRLENIRRRIIEVTDRQMAGSIECIATNGVGEPARAGVDMVVHCKFYLTFACPPTAVRRSMLYYVISFLLGKIIVYFVFIYSFAGNQISHQYSAFQIVVKRATRMHYHCSATC